MSELPDPRVRRGDPDTSRDAAASWTSEELRRTYRALLRAMASLGRPVTDWEAAERAMQLDQEHTGRHQLEGIRRRMGELRELGLITWVYVDGKRLRKGRRGVSLPTARGFSTIGRIGR
jgi:hypothetical protein